MSSVEQLQAEQEAKMLKQFKCGPLDKLEELKKHLKEPKDQAMLARISKLSGPEMTKQIKDAIALLSKEEKKNFKESLNAKSYKRMMKMAKYDTVDWTSSESIFSTFPLYKQRQLAAERDRKLASRAVSIEDFRMLLPLTNENLIDYCHLNIEPNKKFFLSGLPGTGKSVLFRTLAKGGVRDFPDHLNVHLCEEIEVSTDAVSLLETVVSADGYRVALLECKKRLTAISETQVVAGGEEKLSSDDMEKIKDNLKMVNLKLEQIRSDTAEDRAGKMLRVLGFDEVAQTKSTNDLSGGLRMRVALCAAFFLEPDILLLDEPTNHLDFPSLLWLENRLRSYRKTFILTSNDRELIENTCYSVMLIEDKKLSYYDCGFHAFIQKRDKANEEKSLLVDRFLARHRNVDPSTPLAREKKQKQDWLNAYQEYKVMMQGKFTFPPIKELKNNTGADCAPEDIPIIDLKNVRFSYDPAKLPFVFDTPIDFLLKADTRVGIMGPNGAGKSTFLKLLTGRLEPVSGSVTRHNGADIAYFSQHVTMELDLEDTPIEYMLKMFPGVKAGLLRNHLSKVGISGDKADTQMKALTGGQQSCCVFAKVTYTCPHLLILDEPTNFLDMASVDALVSAADKFKGALLVVSHCRSFLKRCASQYLSIVPGQFLIFDCMKKCEHATYTFIQELESGQKVSAKDLVAKQKHSSGASNKDVVMEKLDRDKNGVVILGAITPTQNQATSKSKRELKEQAEAEKEAKIKADKKAAKAKKAKAKMAIEWKAGDKCLALKNSKYVPGTIVRSNAVGITVEYDNGGKKMLSAKQVQPFDAAAVQNQGNQKGGNQKGGNNNNPGRGGNGGGRGRGGGGRGRGGGGRGRGGGGRGGRGQQRQ